MGSGGETELSTLLAPFLDVIIQECRHVKDVYERRYRRTIERLYLTGGGANLPGIEKYFSEQIALPILLPPPLGGLSYNPELEPIAKNLSNELLVAVGAAQRYFQ
jgi:Tfp pilus assembly PilM family ATPase